MANTDIILPTDAARELPAVRSIGVRDLRDALAMGLQDFWAMPTHVIFLDLIYPVIGLVLFRAMFGHDLIPFSIPLPLVFRLSVPLRPSAFTNSADAANSDWTRPGSMRLTSSTHPHFSRLSH